MKPRPGLIPQNVALIDRPEMPTHKLYPTRGFYPKHKMLYHPKLKTQYVPIWIKWRLTATETVRIPF